MLRHIATRNTSWPEFCLSALDELTSAVKESSSMQGNMWSVQGTAAVRSEAGNSNGTSRPLATSRIQRTPTPKHTSQQRQSGQGDAASSFPQVVASSPGLAEEPENQFIASGSSNQQWQSGEPPQTAARYDSYAASPGLAGASQDAPWNYQQALQGANGGQLPSGIPGGGAQSGNGLIPGEGQESAMWYDQLFATSFSAIDNPFLAAAHFDPSIDPTWSYLR